MGKDGLTYAVVATNVPHTDIKEYKVFQWSCSQPKFWLSCLPLGGKIQTTVLHCMFTKC